MEVWVNGEAEELIAGQKHSAEIETRWGIERQRRT